MTKQRILLISLVGFLIFALLLGGKLIYQKKWVDAGIMSQSQQIPGVISATILSDNGSKEMVVDTDHLTNLRQASRTLLKLAAGVPIRFKDHENQALENLYGQLGFALQEGIARGNFTEMAQEVKTQAQEAGVEVDLEMDADYIYLLMNQGDAQLIEVMQRHGQGSFLPSESK